MLKKVFLCLPMDAEQEEVLLYVRYALTTAHAPVVPNFYLKSVNQSSEGEELVLSAGRSLIWFCDEFWICGSRITPQMQSQIELCKHLSIRTRTLTEQAVRKKLGGISQ